MCDYTLKIILDLTQNYPDNMVHIKDISRRQNIPRKFLEQILLNLKKGGFLQSKKGPNGGYLLARNPKDITFGSVIRYIEGPIYPVPCIDPDTADSCEENDAMVFIPVWQELHDSISGVIDNINFQDLKERLNEMKSSTALDFQI